MKLQITPAILATLSASFAVAEDFKTNNGKEANQSNAAEILADPGRMSGEAL